MRKRNLIATTAFATLLLLTFSPAAGAVRGVTDTEIRIGQWGPQTGPAALWGAVARGSGVYFKMINEEGGIHGRKIELIAEDDGYKNGPSGIGEHFRKRVNRLNHNPMTNHLVKSTVKPNQIFSSSVMIS